MAEKLTLAEQETIILYNRAEQTAEVFTYEPTLKRRLSAMAEEYEEVIISVADNGAGGATYLLPKKLVSIRKPIKKKKLTEEERKELTARLQGNGARREGENVQ